MSSIGAAKAALVAILGAALPDSQVVPGPVDVTTLSPRILEVGGTSTPILFQPSDMAGAGGTETYTLMLTISVSSPATALAMPEDAALDDFALAVAAIRANPSLGLSSLNATCTGDGELLESADANARAAAVRFPVEIFTTF